MGIFWSIKDLAESSGVSSATIKRMEEVDDTPKVFADNLGRVQKVLESAGVEFIASNGGGPGVRLKKTGKGVEEISQEIDALEDKISSMPAPTEPSPEAGMNIMSEVVAKNDEAQKPPLADHTTRPFEMSAQCSAVTGGLECRHDSQGAQLGIHWPPIVTPVFFKSCARNRGQFSESACYLPRFPFEPRGALHGR